jgi:hypothetical protein
LIHGDFDICILDCAAGKREGVEFLKGWRRMAARFRLCFSKEYDNDPVAMKSQVYPSNRTDSIRKLLHS